MTTPLDAAIREAADDVAYITLTRTGGEIYGEVEKRLRTLVETAVDQVAREAQAWRPIETAPRDGTEIDLWAKTWSAYDDSFVFKRFPGCYWRERFENSRAEWVHLEAGWYATHWQPLPPPPKTGEPAEDPR